LKNKRWITQITIQNKNIYIFYIWGWWSNYLEGWNLIVEQKSTSFHLVGMVWNKNNSWNRAKMQTIRTTQCQSNFETDIFIFVYFTIVRILRASVETYVLWFFSYCWRFILERKKKHSKHSIANDCVIIIAFVWKLFLSSNRFF
jgi:hypothetical protein